MKGAAALVFSLAAATVGLVQPRVATRFHTAGVTGDVYDLPPPTAAVIASLGHRSALADLIFANLLVSYGTHAQEHRRLEFAGEYIDTVNALDPRFRDPYRFADTLLVIGPDEPKEANYFRAREVFERGLKNRPYDTELWLTAGQYLVYLGGPHLSDPKVRDEWRVAGAKILARACELASNNDRVPYQCVAAASLLNSAGEREAAIQSLERLLAVSDDPEIQRLAAGYLDKKLSERTSDRLKHRREVFRDAWTADLPFISKDAMLVLGPKTDIARCAGYRGTTDVACVTSWAAWASVTDPIE
jgi:tetratricopeptide (TPR) repeat protein